MLITGLTQASRQAPRLSSDTRAVSSTDSRPDTTLATIRRWLCLRDGVCDCAKSLSASLSASRQSFTSVRLVSRPTRAIDLEL
jgi:hypothetical protein